MISCMQDLYFHTVSNHPYFEKLSGLLYAGFVCPDGEQYSNSELYALLLSSYFETMSVLPYAKFKLDIGQFSNHHLFWNTSLKGVQSNQD